MELWAWKSYLLAVSPAVSTAFLRAVLNIDVWRGCNDCRIWAERLAFMELTSDPLDLNSIVSNASPSSNSQGSECPTSNALVRAIREVTSLIMTAKCRRIAKVNCGVLRALDPWFLVQPIQGWFRWMFWALV